MLPTPYVLQVKPYAGQDADEEPTYDFPRDWLVSAIAPGSMTEPFQSNRDLSLVAFTVLAPLSEAQPGERDLVVIDGVDYPVDGRPADWTRGPWTSAAFAGVQVELKRPEG